MLKFTSLTTRDIYLRCLRGSLQRFLTPLHVHIAPLYVVTEARGEMETLRHLVHALMGDVLDSTESAWFTERFVSLTKGKSDDSLRSL